jgi:hypothetical protein
MIRVSRPIIAKRTLAAVRVPIVSRRSTSSNQPPPNDAKEVLIATYAKENQTVTNAAQSPFLFVNETKTSPMTFSGGDGERSAIAFDSSITGKMTPTMKMFTLEGKVAVVTGYVLGIS